MISEYLTKTFKHGRTKICRYLFCPEKYWVAIKATDKQMQNAATAIDEYLKGSGEGCDILKEQLSHFTDDIQIKINKMCGSNDHSEDNIKNLCFYISMASALPYILGEDDAQLTHTSLMKTITGSKWKCVGFTCGDVIGQPMEFVKKEYRKVMNYIPFSLASHYTDDTVMTIAVMKWLLGGELTNEKLVQHVVDLGTEHWAAGYGGNFNNWLHGSTNYQPYESYGNGSAMRVSPVAWFFDTEEDVLKYAKMSADITHNHPEGVKGAQAIAMCIFLARTGSTKDEIKEYIEKKFGYDLSRTTDMIRPDYIFHVDCQQSVPESIICFLEAKSTLEAIQLAISLGGDTDTMADMAGAIAEAYYGDCDDLFEDTIEKSFQYPKAFVEVIKEFNEKISE